MKFITRKGAIVSILVILFVWAVAVTLGRFNSKADPREVSITNLSDYKAYEALDREQAGYLAQSQQLQIMFNNAKEKKAAIQARIGAPKDFVEKREDDSRDAHGNWLHPDSPVVAFVAPAVTVPK